MSFVLPGVALAAIGFVILFGLLASEDALSKSRQFAALGRLGSGRAGGGKRLAFFLALAAMGFGACGAFAGVAASDNARARACERTCKERGYARGSIRGSTAVDPQKPQRHAFVACACEGGTSSEPLELRADELRF